jgi:hypothetical protein
MEINYNEFIKFLLLMFFCAVMPCKLITSVSEKCAVICISTSEMERIRDSGSHGGEYKYSAFWDVAPCSLIEVD